MKMHKIRAAVTAKSRHFLRDENGNAVIESVFMLPLVLWAAFVMVVFWDGYHVMNKLQKASYTVSDVVSRWQGDPLQASDVNGLLGMMTYLLNEEGQQPRFRLSSIIWVAMRNRYEVQWSCSMDPVPLPPYTTTSLQLVADRLPMAADGTTQILVETEFDYDMLTKIPGNSSNAASNSVRNVTFGEFIPVRPRFAAVVFNNPAACN